MGTRLGSMYSSSCYMFIITLPPVFISHIGRCILMQVARDGDLPEPYYNWAFCARISSRYQVLYISLYLSHVAHCQTSGVVSDF